MTQIEDLNRQIEIARDNIVALQKQRDNADTDPNPGADVLHDLGNLDDQITTESNSLRELEREREGLQQRA